MRRSILALVALSCALTIPLRAQADETVIQRDVVQGSPAVMNSWMEPAYERVRECTDGDGTVRQIREPIIMERHERVSVPISEQRTTTTVVDQPVVETRVYKAIAPVYKRKVALKRKAVAFGPKHRYVAHHVYHRPSSLIAYKTVRKIEQPTIIQRTENYRQENLIYDRRDPSLDM